MPSYQLSAPARLHFGFLDFQRDQHAFGSVGLVLSEPCFKIEVNAEKEFEVEGKPSQAASRQRVVTFAKQQFALYGEKPYGCFKICSDIPAHSGLGSGTQIALAVGHLVARMLQKQPDSRTIAQQTGRGKRSGIGIGAFDQGGFLVDGGKQDETPPCIIARHAFPVAWRVVLILNPAGDSVYGREEIEKFARLPSFSKACAGALCHNLLLGILPALVRCHYQNFATMLTRMQNYLGDYFSEVQGHRYADPQVRLALEYLQEQGIQCAGQSSWGPTGFAIVENQAMAEKVVEQLEKKFLGAHWNLVWKISQGNNQGAVFNKRSIESEP